MSLAQFPFICNWPWPRCIIGLMQNEKTSVMTTPKHLGAQIWQIYPRSVGRCIPSYWHLVAKFGRSTLDLLADVPPLTSSGQIWQIYPRSAGRCTPIQTSSGQIWQIYPRSAGRCTPYWHLVAKNGNFRFLLSQLI